MTRNNDAKTYTDERGKFAPGNPGRPKGSRHKTTLAVEELLDGEAEALTRRAVEMALEGDSTAMRLCLERVAPARKDTPISFELPEVTTAADASAAASAVLSAVASGDITPSEGAAAMSLIDGFRRTLELTELDQRLRELEARL